MATLTAVATPPCRPQNCLLEVRDRASEHVRCLVPLGLGWGQDACYGFSLLGGSDRVASVLIIPKSHIIVGRVIPIVSLLA